MTAPAPSPISWLRLERYHLGEAGADERRHIEARLADCETTRARLDQIRADHRPMPALPSPAPAAATPSSSRWWLTAAPPVLALAAAVLLFVLPPRTTPEADIPPSRILTRGGEEIAIGLTRLRGGQADASPEGFLPGDRFSVRLTCPPGERSWGVAVFQGGERYTPLASGQAVTCGNNVSLPGAFALDGEEDVLVCAALSAEVPASPQGATVCRRLRAAEATPVPE